MKKSGTIALLIIAILVSLHLSHSPSQRGAVLGINSQSANWLLLHRKSNKEFLYYGIPGNIEKSILTRTFHVKVGIPGQRPTPLPKMLGKKYWLINQKMETSDNPETAPYFLTLNIPITDDVPFGPTPYMECNDPSTGENAQCNWELPGSFGLHGVNGDETRLSAADPGSSGCIRHTDADITYLYKLLDPQIEATRYYIEDV